ncbi:InlB B-repeat-containing protein [Candidatus Saccharibacteria bacterium]|nr:InlB B-repeat-containing protein [Candidatus Saccharibacteria bacterium]
MFSHKHYLRFARFVCTITLLFAISSIANIFNTANTSAATYEASISTSGSVTLDVSPAGNGASVTTDTLNIISTCPEGYEVLIQGPADTTLYKDGNKSNTAATKKINASAGTKDTPRGIMGIDTTSGTSNINTWGYSIGDPATGNTFTPATIHSTSFIGLNNSLTSLYTKNSGTTATGDNLPVYYGVSVDTSIETGSYTMAETTAGANDNKIVYSLVTNPNCMTYQVAFNPTSTAGGTTVSGTGTMANQRITEGIATPLTTNAFTAPEGYTFVGWNTKQDGTGTSYTNTQSVTNLTTAGNTITLYAQWKPDCPANTICYNDNGANSPTTMSNQTVDPGATEVTLWASNFKRPDYGFAGWSTISDLSWVGSCSGDALHGIDCLLPQGGLYGPNETVVLANDEFGDMSGGVTLYAIWVPVVKGSNNNELTFQTANLLTTTLNNGYTLSAMPTNYITALRDERDNQVYAIAKLADGKYWMIENLRLGGGITLNAANTHNPVITTLTESTNWCIDVDANCINRPYVSNSTFSTDEGAYLHGAYYNWYSATAGNGTYETENLYDDVVAGDICPYAWHLPTAEGSAINEFGALDIVLGGTGDYQTTAEASNRWRRFPVNFVYSGHWYYDDAHDINFFGEYWSSSPANNEVASSFFIGSYHGDYDDEQGTIVMEAAPKELGLSVRCILGV